MINERDININYLSNRTIWPRNVIEYLYDNSYEKYKNHKSTIEDTCTILLKKQQEISKEELLEIEKIITVENVSLSLN
jgi:hypothetical protein